MGDSIYVQAVARHLVSKGERLMVSTDWRDVFRPLGDRVEFKPFTRQGINVLAHYSVRKSQPTGQFEDVCITAGAVGAELKLDWPASDSPLVEMVKEAAAGRPIVLVQLPRAPMARTDGFGQELLPDCRVLQRAINAMRGRVLLVQVGSGTPQFRFTGIDIDLADKTTVPELFDLGVACDGVLGYVSFILPMAESLGKRALLVWSRRGLKSGTTYVRQITPAKVVHRKDLVTSVIDDEEIEGAADAFLR